ncbi:chorismate synthase 1, chloroplastic-like [Musa acuminata AAA Group]
MSIAYRPIHADATYDFKYGLRAIQIIAYVSRVHKVVLPEGVVDNEIVTLDQIESNIIRCPDPEYAQKMIEAIDAVRVRGDSVGGVVTCIARNVPRGLGCPVFDKLEADLAKAMLSLPATKGFEFGSGFSGTFMTGSEHNDEFYIGEHGRDIQWRNHLYENSF